MNSPTDQSSRLGMFYWQVDRPFNARETKEVFLDRYAAISESEAIQAVEYGLSRAGFSQADSKVNNIRLPEKSFSSVNLIFFATLPGNREVIIRIHPRNIKNGYFWAERLAAKMARKQDVPVYETYYVNDSREIFPFDFMIIERLPGNNIKSLWPLDPNLEKNLLEQTGEYLAGIHQVKTVNYGFFNNGYAKTNEVLQGIYPKWTDHFLAAYEKNLKYLLDNQVITKDDWQKIVNIIGSHTDLVKCDSPRLIHNDLADWNELTDGINVTGILDWDECFSGDPVMDFAQWSVFFPYERMEHLIRGYQKVADLPEAYQEKLHLYRLRYIVSKSVSRHMKQVFAPNETYKSMLEYALKILKDEFVWYGL
jgi:aminoglycoside phosphotransferase (APT) family kinase protein